LPTFAKPIAEKTIAAEDLEVSKSDNLMGSPENFTLTNLKQRLMQNFKEKPPPNLNRLIRSKMYVCRTFLPNAFPIPPESAGLDLQEIEKLDVL
jgi:hypothetical protein